MGEIPVIGDNNPFMATHPCKMGIPKVIISKSYPPIGFPKSIGMEFSINVQPL